MPQMGGVVRGDPAHVDRCGLPLGGGEELARHRVPDSHLRRSTGNLGDERCGPTFHAQTLSGVSGIALACPDHVNKAARVNKSCAAVLVHSLGGGRSQRGPGHGRPARARPGVAAPTEQALDPLHGEQRRRRGAATFQGAREAARGIVQRVEQSLETREVAVNQGSPAQPQSTVRSFGLAWKLTPWSMAHSRPSCRGGSGNPSDPSC